VRQVSTTATRAGAVCGALVGVCSALLTTAAHTAVAGMLPSGAASVIVLLIGAAVGAGTGAAAITGRWVQPRHAVVALAAGQLLGHLALATASSGHGAHHLLPSAPMLAAHTAAAVIIGLLISLVAHLYVVCVSVLCWLSLVFVRRDKPLPRPVPGTNSVVFKSISVVSGVCLRAPPRMSY
jgi:hypothetical protein